MGPPVQERIRSVELNLLPPSRRKAMALGSLSAACRNAANDMLHIYLLSLLTVGRKRPTSTVDFHHLTYKAVQGKYALPSQTSEEVRKWVWAALTNGSEVREFRRCPVPANIPRSGSLVHTRRGKPVLTIAANGGRIALPVAQDGAWERFQGLRRNGYEFTAFSVVRRGTCWQARMCLKKRFPVKPWKNVLGVDIGSRSMAVTVVSPEGRTLWQGYVGQELAPLQFSWERRRSLLRSHADEGSSRARRALRRLRRKQRDSTKWRVWDMAHALSGLALKFQAAISLEDRVPPRARSRSRKGNRKANRIPWGMLKTAVRSVGASEGVLVQDVSAWRSSRICSRCGCLGVRDTRNRLFRCFNWSCRYVGNPDRNASRNIATRLLERALPERADAQFSGRGGAVNLPVRRRDRAGLQPTLGLGSHVSGKATVFRRW